jgi:hypothetical protein
MDYVVVLAVTVDVGIAIVVHWAGTNQPYLDIHHHLDND